MEDLECRCPCRRRHGRGQEPARQRQPGYWPICSGLGVDLGKSGELVRANPTDSVLLDPPDINVRIAGRHSAVPPILNLPDYTCTSSQPNC